MYRKDEAHTSVDDCRRLLEALPGLPTDSRIEAIESLIRTSSPEIRQQTLHVGSALLSDDRLVGYLRDDEDSVLRNAGLEILKMRGGRGFRVAMDLLDDPDPDVALQAVLILDHLKNPCALEGLLGMLDHDDPNVVQAAIVAIGHLGDRRAVAELIPFLDADPWLQMAAVEALGDLKCPEAVEPLSALLTDLMLGPLAVEALARIGGQSVLDALARHWLRFGDRLDAESMLGLLAHVLEGESQPPRAPEGLRKSVVGFLDQDGEVAAAATRILLVLGASEHDGRALETLSAVRPNPTSLPACLRLRGDLSGELLAGEEPLRTWGLLLAARYPEEAPVVCIVWALNKISETQSLPAVARCLAEVRSPRLDGPLLDLYLRLPARERRELHGPMAARKERLRTLIEKRSDLAAANRIELLALVDEPAEMLIGDLLALEEGERVEVISQLFDRPDLLRRLPWMELVAEAPETYAALAADAAAALELRELLPRLRELLQEDPKPELIRAVGELGDRDAVPVLRELRRARPELEPMALKALGEIGGTEAREELRAAIGRGRGDSERIGYRALSMCATESDEEIFVEAASHTDWNVRLAVAEVLGQSGRDRHLPTLARLASDPIAIVSQRALSFLES